MPWQRLTLAQLPAPLRPAGQLLEAGRWLDLNGENLLVLARAVATDDEQVGEGRLARLIARQYARPANSTGNYQQIW